MDKKIQQSRMTRYDEKGNVLREPREKDYAGQDVNFRWWKVDDKDRSGAVLSTVTFIKTHQGSRLPQLIDCTRMYGNSNSYNSYGNATSRSSNANNPLSQRISFNVIESIVDSLQSRMAKNKIIPTYITNGGDWSVQFKAQQLTKFVGGLFYGQHVHKKTIGTWTDSGIWGDGFLKIFEKDKKVCIERVLPHDILVDMIESQVGAPRQLHQTKLMDRDLAFELFPELEEAIAKVAPASYDTIGAQGTACDIINVIESWHLKSGPQAKDGMRAITIGDGSIAEVYDEDYLPFAHMRYARRPLGWYGQGIPERVGNLQSEINRSMILKQRSHWMQASFKILVPIGSKIVTQHLNNEVGSVITYSGEPPTYITPPATSPDLQMWIDWLIAAAYSQEGISKMASTAEAPMGVESGKALRTLMQVSDDRFLFMQQEMESLALEVARQSVNLAKKIYKKTGKYEVIFPDNKFMETVDWGSIQLDEEQYTLKAFPSSSLADDLPGKLSEIQELAQAGMVTPRTAKRLLDMPDLEVNSALANSKEDRLHQIFEEMINHKKYTRFEPAYHDAKLAQELGIEYVNYAEFHNCPDENVQLVRDYLDQVNSEVLAPMNQMAQTQAQPQASPEPAPTNNLIANVPGAA